MESQAEARGVGRAGALFTLRVEGHRSDTKGGHGHSHSAKARSRAWEGERGARRFVQGLGEG